jgi:hypothetical protein
MITIFCGANSLNQRVKQQKVGPNACTVEKYQVEALISEIPSNIFGDYYDTQVNMLEMTMVPNQRQVLELM